MTVDGWIPVDPLTLETSYPDVYAVGDVTSVGTPKAGVFAEGQAGVVADAHHRPGAAAATRRQYDGRGICYLEFGNDEVAKVDVMFEPGPAAHGDFLGAVASTSWPTSASSAPAASSGGSAAPGRRRASRSYAQRSGDEVDDDLGELRAAVLLEEVAAAGDGGVGLALRAGDAADQVPLVAGGDLVLVAERAQERAIEGGQHLPRGPVGGRLGILGRGRARASGTGARLPCRSRPGTARRRRRSRRR